MQLKWKISCPLNRNLPFAWDYRTDRGLELHNSQLIFVSCLHEQQFVGLVKSQSNVPRACKKRCLGDMSDSHLETGFSFSIHLGEYRRSVCGLSTTRATILHAGIFQLRNLKYLGLRSRDEDSDIKHTGTYVQENCSTNANGTLVSGLYDF